VFDAVSGCSCWIGEWKWKYEESVDVWGAATPAAAGTGTEEYTTSRRSE